ncbi:hypothetical protein FISHEDRAFT_68698 [Fistulina hepatica ATCC 64428]|uniref:Uncharacterized protein n=1 Tax=Fistulina hepatica ATCC 64428 TaxID=1128425 RepID=A0A0D7AQJ6_9AGAR|nr:hypothetical protein FISHEDRAFT_68698 [Fistulina hepatica ATCC 64428]
MAANKEIDDQVRKDIRTLSATLTRETGVSPLATSSDAREHLSDVDAIVALLTTATDDDELGNRVVAVTASRQAGCIETLLVTRNPRGDYGISESVVGVKKSDDSVEAILAGWKNSDPVPWEDYVRDLITLMNDWHLSDADELLKLYTLHLLILRRCYYKLVARMLLGEKLWGGDPFSLIHKCLTTQPDESFEPFTVEVTLGLAQRRLQKWNISPSSTPDMYTVDRNNVTIWFNFLRKQYSNVRRCLVETDSGKSRARRSVSDDDFQEAAATLGVLQNIAASRLVPTVIGAVPKLWITFAKSQCFTLLRMPPDLSPEDIEDALEVIPDDVSDVTSEALARNRVDRYLRTMMSPIWAVIHLHRVVLSQPPSVIRAYIARVPAIEKPVQIADIDDLVGRLKWDNASQMEMIEWLEEHRFQRHANQHAEAVLMGLLCQQSSTSAMFASNEKLPISVGRRCCFCCYKLGQLLENGRLNNDDDLRTHMPALILPGTHGVVYGWVAPSGIPTSILLVLKGELLEVVKTVAKRAKTSVLSSPRGHNTPPEKETYDSTSALGTASPDGGG